MTTSTSLPIDGSIRKAAEASGESIQGVLLRPCTYGCTKSYCISPTLVTDGRTPPPVAEG